MAILKRAAQSDAADLVSLFTCPKGRNYLGGPLSVGDAQRRIAEILSDKHSMLWTIEEGESFCAMVILSMHHNGKEKEISYQLAKEAWGKGIASCVIKTLLEELQASGEMEILLAETQRANLASIRLLQGLGFVERDAFVRFGAEQLLFEFIL